MSIHRIHLSREHFKFSCAHMTVFPNGTKERLHGHNFTLGLTVELSDIAFEHMIAFQPLKSAVERLCAEWKETTLIAKHNPYFSIVHENDSEIEFILCDQRYVLPRRDVMLLPIDNVSVETLAAHAVDRLVRSLDAPCSAHIRSLEVTVTESPGQGASCHRILSSKEKGLDR